jgi:ABC-type lipoprotein release transport system permease subunit
MKFIISLAFKNLTRYKRRTIITAAAIAVGLMMFIAVDSLLLGAEYESMRNLRWYETSSARIMRPEYHEDRLLMPLDVSIEHPYDIVKQLRSEGIAAAPRIMFAADMILYSEDFGEDGNMAVQVTAVDPELDNSVFRFEETLVAGRFPEAGTNELVIGSWFAEDIGAELGYWVTLVTRGNGGFYEAMDMQIVGIVNCPNPNVNRTLLMVPIDTISDYLAMEGNATEINISLPESSDLSGTIERIRGLVDPTGSLLTVVSWDELARDYVALAEAKRGGTGMILFLVFIIAAVGISNTMLMAIFERMRELGMMRALGMDDRGIQLAFMVEAGGIGLIGSTIGVILGILLNLYLANVGINFGLLMRDLDMGYRIQSSFKGVWSPSTIATAFFFGTILSMLVAYIPTRRALKMDIPSCLRHQ